MKRFAGLILLFALVFSAVSLSTSWASAEDVGGNAAAKNSAVKVDKSGTTFNPAVDKASIPDGAWYCDMGDVHYARGQKGDGQCEVCGMKLTQKVRDTKNKKTQMHHSGDHDHHSGDHDHHSGDHDHKGHP